MMKRIMMEKIVKIIKKVKIRNIIILILLIMFNTYAWFIYATKVATDISVHIASWNVEFATGADETTTNILVQIDRAYPGMEDYVKEIKVINKGEMKAELRYNVKSLKVMNEQYIVGENITLEELQNKIDTEYPFKIKITKDDEELKQGIGDGKFEIRVEWPYESGDDEKDTLWGNKAYKYYEENQDRKIIEIQLDLTAKQITD
jgi:hypothetical protein